MIALRSTIGVLGDGLRRGGVEHHPPEHRERTAGGPAGAADQRGRLRDARHHAGGAPSATRGQQASLVSFSADAYVNEMGITSNLQPNENTSNGRPVPKPPGAPPGVDTDGVDVELFAVFMRSTLAPPVDPGRSARPMREAGSQIFNNIGCAVCHTRTIATSPPGTLINGGAARVPTRWATRSSIRSATSSCTTWARATASSRTAATPPATRSARPRCGACGHAGRFLHDGLSFSLEDAIARHGGQAATARTNFNNQSSFNRKRVLAFLLSLLTL